MGVKIKIRPPKGRCEVKKYRRCRICFAKREKFKRYCSFHMRKNDFAIRYKTCRAAFRAMSEQYEREKKLAVKNRQRIIGLCNAIRSHAFPDSDILNQTEKILGILEVKGYEKFKQGE